MREMTQIACDYCGKVHTKELRQVKENEKLGHKNFCSKECLANFRKTSVQTYCTCCGKEIEVRLAEYKRSKSGFHYCSRSCATKINNTLKIGTNHPNFKDGSGTYREQALRHYGSFCSVCGYNIEPALEVHHRDSNRRNNKLENLDVLCATHHKEYGLGIRTYEDIKQEIA